MELPQSFETRRLANDIENWDVASLGGGVIHHRDPCLNAVDQGVARARTKSMMRDYENVDLAQEIFRTHELHLLVPGEISQVENFNFAAVDQYTERVRVLPPIHSVRLCQLG